MKEEQYTFSSAVLGNERNLWIRTPKGSGKNWKLLLVLDAELYRGGVGAPGIIDRFYEKNGMDQVLVVYVSTCDSEARWIECACYPPFVTFIDEELCPWIIERYPSVKKSEEWIIAGLSYTGLAASYVALKAKNHFSKVISQSGSYWWNDCWLGNEYEKCQTRPGLRFYLDVGDEETDVRVQHKEDVYQEISQIEGVECFREVLERKGYEVSYEEFSGGHSCEAWAKTLPSALEWALLSNRFD